MESTGSTTPLSLPTRAPVMPLPGAVLLPHALLPLFIFEDRYRKMLAHALESERMVCVAQYRPGVEEAVRDEEIHDVAGIGVVRACVGHPDGTSHLILQGLARVRLIGYEQRTPFRLARLGVMPSEHASNDGEEVLREALRGRLTALANDGVGLPPLVAQLIEAEASLDLMSDLVAGALIGDPSLRQAILETPEVNARASLLLQAMTV